VIDGFDLNTRCLPAAVALVNGEQLI